jgi:hypothetical protein
MGEIGDWGWGFRLSGEWETPGRDWGRGWGPRCDATFGLMVGWWRGGVVGWGGGVGWRSGGRGVGYWEDLDAVQLLGEWWGI